MRRPSGRRVVFWAALASFLAWDHLRAPPIDLRFEPPLLAAGSGQTATAGHCALPR